MADQVAPIINPATGERMVVPSEQAQSMLATGVWRRESREEYNAAEAKVAATAGFEGKANTAVEAVARSLSAGTSDLLWQKNLPPEELAKVRARAETGLATGIELGTDVVTAVASAGTAAVAKQGAKSLLKAGVKEGAEEVGEKLVKEAAEAGSESLVKQGVKAAAKGTGVAIAAAPSTVLGAGTQLLGEGAEAGLKRLGVNDVLARAGGMVVEGATDATVYKLRENISETALGDEELTAEKLLVGTGDAMGLGGVTGGGLGLLLGGASKALNKSKKLVGELKDGGVPEPVLDAAARFGAFGGAGDVKEVRRLLGDMSIARKWSRKHEVLPEISSSIAKSFDEMSAVQKVEKRIFAGDIKADNLERTIRKGDGAEAAQFSAASRATDDLGRMIGNHEVVDEAGRRIVRARQQLFEDVVGKGPAKELREIHSRAQNQLQEARASGNVGVKSYEAVEQMKRDLRDLRKRVPKATVGANTTVQKQLAALDNITRDQEFAVARMLEDADTWGAAGANQAFRNQAFRELAETNDAFEALFTKPTREAERLGGKSTRYHDPDKIKAFVSNLDNDARKLAQDQARRHLDARETLLTGMLERGDVPADAIEDFQRAIAATRSAKQTFTEAADTVRDIHMMDRMLRNENEGILAARPVTGAILGGVVGGPLGALATSAVTGLMRPASLMRQMVVVESMANRLKSIDGKLDGAVKSHVRGLRMRTAQAARGVTKMAPPAVARYYGADQGERRKKVEREVTNLRKVIDAPEVGLERAKRLTSGLTDSAPGVTAALSAKHARAVQFLASKLPPPPPVTSPFAKPKHARLTDQQVNTMARYMTATSRPRSVLDDLQAGTLSAEAAEAIRAVYPKFHAELTQKLVAELSRAEVDVPFSATVQLSILLGVPLHPMMTPQFRAAQDERYQMAEQERQSPPPERPSNTAVLQTAENAATLSEKVVASL